MDIEQALTLVAPQGYVRIFLDEGNPMRILISHWLVHQSFHPAGKYAERLLSHFVAEEKLFHTTLQKSSIGDFRIQSNMALLEPLSERELEVLDLMALGMSNKEIAARLIVAPGTIKAHAASIYRKLNAANRTAAISRARQLKILL